MKFENSKQNSFLGKWRYQAQIACRVDKYTDPTGEEREKFRSKKDREIMESVESFLRDRAVGDWCRVGNCLYMNKLDDIFNVRLFFDDSVAVIRQAAQ